LQCGIKNWFTLEDVQQAVGTYHVYLLYLLQTYLKCSSRTNISAVWGDARCMLLLMPVNNHLRNLTTDTCKMWNVSSPPALILRHSGNYTTVTGFVTVLLVVLLCSRLVIAICRFEVMYKLEIICSKKFPSLYLHNWFLRKLNRYLLF
jgi:hypothetical protein